MAFEISFENERWKPLAYGYEMSSAGRLRKMGRDGLMEYIMPVKRSLYGCWNYDVRTNEGSRVSRMIADFYQEAFGKAVPYTAFDSHWADTVRAMSVMHMAQVKSKRLEQVKALQAAKAARKAQREAALAKRREFNPGAIQEGSIDFIPFGTDAEIPAVPDFQSGFWYAVTI